MTWTHWLSGLLDRKLLLRELLSQIIIRYSYKPECMCLNYYDLPQTLGLPPPCFDNYL